LAKGADGHVLTLASGLPSWVTSGGAATIANGELDLFRLDQTNAAVDYTIVWKAVDDIRWEPKQEFGLAQFYHFNSNFVFFELSGDDSAAGGNAYIQNRSGMSNSASGIDDLATGTLNDWSWMRRPTKLWGLGLTHDQTHVDANGSGLGSPPGTEDDKYFHYYDFSIGNQALEDSRGNADIKVDDTSSLIFELTYSLPYHGAALFQRSYSNSSEYRLLWANTSSPYDGFIGGGQQLKVDRLEMDTHNQGYFFRLIYWENGSTPSTRPRFNLHLAGHVTGKQVTGS
jgi:hypothetical protein